MEDMGVISNVDSTHPVVYQHGCRAQDPRQHPAVHWFDSSKQVGVTRNTYPPSCRTGIHNICKSLGIPKTGCYLRILANSIVSCGLMFRELELKVAGSILSTGSTRYIIQTQYQELMWSTYSQKQKRVMRLCSSVCGCCNLKLSSYKRQGWMW